MLHRNHQSSPLYPSIIQWAFSHLRALQFACSELMRTPFANLITVSIIGIAIALPLGFYVLLKNLQIVDSAWNTSAPTISLYLKTDTTPTALDTLMQTLHNNPHINSVRYISPQEGLTAFKKNTPFSDVIKLLQNNPIPSVITVLPTAKDQSPDAVNALFLTLKQSPLVDVAQLDMNWVTRLYDMISVGKKITNGLSILFGFGVILIIGHTLRASLSNHMNEVQVMRLLGATNAYIRRPLLYRGILYGFLGGSVAWIFINILLIQLQRPIEQLAQTYHTFFQLQLISFSLGFPVLLVSISAGFISAWLITTHFLNQPEQMD